MRFSRRLVVTALTIVLMAAACSGTDADDTTNDTADNPADKATDDGPTTTATFRTGSTVDETVPDEFAALALEEKIDQFLETPTSPLATSIAAEMAADGDPRWGPWLLDLLRLGPSNLTDERVAEALAVISGVERDDDNFVTDDYRIYGGWVYDQAIDPGPGYRDFKLGLYGPLDDDFESLLASVEDDVTLSRIQWGGVPRGGIPELNEPERVTPAEADWMEPDEIVFGAVIDGEAVAYPFRILGHHELANDTIAGNPVALVFCTLCRTALLFDRRIPAAAAGDSGAGSGADGLVVDLQTSGLLSNSNKIMVDIQTDTLWSHLEGVGIGGPLDGVELAQLPLETTTWGDWLAANPDTEVLDIPDPVFPENPEQGGPAYTYKPDSPYPGYYDNPEVWFPILDTPTDDLALKDAVLGLRSGGDTLAVSVDAIVAEGPRVFAVGETLVLLVPNSAAGARAYDATDAGLADGDNPEVEADIEAAVLTDGTTLPRLTVDQGFWFAWFGNNPTTDWWPRAG